MHPAPTGLPFRSACSEFGNSPNAGRSQDVDELALFRLIEQLMDGERRQFFIRLAIIDGVSTPVAYIVLVTRLRRSDSARPVASSEFGGIVSSRVQLRDQL